ncbi:MAG: A24 family peptidase [Bradyrhizobium sp.]|jgi:leader peptidase (prepilin peptidase) / N-methyltransferase
MTILLSFGLLCLLCAILAWIDIRDGIIPDWLNLAIAGLGLVKIMMTGDLSAALQAIGEGIAVGGIFWLLRQLYFSYRKIQGLGLGDVKFLAAAGIWVGIAGIAPVLLIATLTALACAGVMQLSGRALTAQTSLSFGPFLAAGLVLTAGFQQYGF